MTALVLASLAVAVLVASYVGVDAIWRYAKLRMLDIPGDRSSHEEPTPRGGGLALTVAHLGGVAALVGFGLLESRLASTMLLGGAAIAVVGFVDDHRHVNAFHRLAVHALAIGWSVSSVVGESTIDFGWGPVSIGAIAGAVLVLALVWFLNLFNFMDGIDGIAGAQAAFMALAGSAAAFVGGADATDTWPMVLLAAAAAGFLAWNWPPAKIFMGDVGSGYVGFALGVMALWTVLQGWLTVWVWVILGGAFVADASTTLAVRAIARQRLTEAHRSHAYQRLSRYWKGHRPVTLAVLVINVGWLGPWALVAARWPDTAVACTVISVAPLFAVALKLGAGRPGEIGQRT